MTCSVNGTNATHSARRRKRLISGWCALALPALAGCAGLPSSGPTAGELVASSSSRSAAYDIVELDISNARAASAQAQPTAPLRALDARGPSAQPDQIYPGDALDISVFEVGASLFAGNRTALDPRGGSGGPSASSQTFPRQRVAEDGSINLPYLGAIHAAGLTPAQLQTKIQQALQGRSQSPQAVVTIGESLGATVMVIGDAKTPGRRPLTAAHERILDALALAGGPVGGKSDSLVRLTRDGVSAQMSLADLTADSPDNIRLRPQDRIEVILRPRTFTAYGASGRVSEVPFQASQVTLAEAIARVGGPLDQQADPTAVFVFRGAHDPKDRGTIYKISLASASGYFAAQMFQMDDKDIIYIANARTNSISKFLGIISSLTTPIVTAKTISK